jgi:DNA-binding MarR family transcriptional regulator
MHNRTSLVYELMGSVRKLTRSSLIHQHLIAQKMGLHVTDAECIDFLMEMGPSTAGALAKATRLTTGAMTNVIDRLETAGFVRRDPDPGDRRKVVVSYIPEKHHDAKVHYAALAKSVETLFSKYTKSELDFLIKHTTALTEIFNNEAIQINQS